jgi:hypothetical protein
MPAFVNMSVASPAGTMGALGTRVWPRCSKNDKKVSRTSIDFMVGL